MIAICATLSSPRAQIDPNFGVPLSAPSNTGAFLGPLVLPFLFLFPDGTITREVYASTFGRVTPFAGQIPDAFPTTSDLVNGPVTIAPYWDSLNVGAQPPATNFEMFYDVRPTSVLITWRDVRLSFSDPALSDFTFQLELFADLSFAFRYDDRMPLAGSVPGFVGNSVMIGVSPGGGVTDPGETDLNLGFESGPERTVYEFANGMMGDVGDLSDGRVTFCPNGFGGYKVKSTTPEFVITGDGCAPRPNVRVPELSISAPPVLGQPLTFSVTSGPQTTAQSLLIGRQLATPIPLDPFGIPNCMLHTDGVFGAVSPPSFNSPIPVRIPISSRLAGLQLQLQGVALSTTQRELVLLSPSATLQLGGI